MRLPATLAPWRQWLDWFEPELAAALGDLLLRLHPLLGAFRLRALRGQVEPEGIDDLRRRGSYERLLLSEWALADAAPEEFDRRAAGGEHLFLSPKLIARQTDALTVAVFDSGPAQLGAPRLLHMALWILLAQRAQAAKARFLWGVLGEPGELHDADSAERLRELLGARAWRFGDGDGGATQTNAALERQWAQYLDGLEPSPGERWSIGAPAPGHGLGHRVGICAAQPGTLMATIASPQARRETTLALPDAEPAARLLRGQFDLRTRTGVAVDVREPRSKERKRGGRLSRAQLPLLSSDGATLAVALVGRNAARVYRLNNSLQQAPFEVRWDLRWPLLAATIDRHRFGGLIACGQSLQFWSLRGFCRGHWPPGAELSSPQGRWLSCAHGHRHGLQPEVWLLAGDVLWSWTEHRSGHAASVDLSASKADQGVLALCESGGGHVSYLRYRDGHLEIAGIAGDGDFHVFRRFACRSTPLSAYMNGWTRHTHWQGVVAVELRAGGHGRERARVWRILRVGERDDLDFEVILPSEWKVIGQSPHHDHPALVAFNPDRNQVVRIGEHERTVMYESPVRLSTGSVSGNGWVTAVVDAAGRLIVLRGRDNRATIYPGGEADD